MREDDLLPVSARGRQAELWTKHEERSTAASSFGLVSRATEHSAFLQMMDTQMRGMMSVFAVGMFGLAMMFVVVLDFILLLGATVFQNRQYGLLLLTIGFLAFNSLAVIVTAISGIRIIRIDIFGPKDIPLVFNRRTRKVYRFAQEVPMFPSSYSLREFLHTLTYLPKYWIESLKPWPMVLVEYDWDCMGAEYQQHTSMSGNVVKTLHHFNLHVRESPTSDRVIGLVTPMSPMLVGSRDSAASLWEFIRRFMEEGGPVLYPGDKPSPPHPRSWLQAAQLLMPYYWVVIFGYAAWATHYLWQNGFTLEGATVSRVSARIFGFICYSSVFIVTCNWLAHKFGMDVDLPEELLQDAGPPLDLQRLAREAAADKNS